MSTDPDSSSPSTSRLTFNAQLAAARAITDERDRVNALATLIPDLPDDLKAQAVREALAVTSAITDEWDRTLALNDLIQQSPNQLKVEIAREALVAACAISDEGHRVFALINLIPHLPAVLKDEVVREALATARAIADERLRAFALFNLIQELPDQLEAETAREALATARAITNEYFRAIVLTYLISHLPAQTAESALISHLPAQTAESAHEVLAATRAITDKHDLFKLFWTLPDDLEAEVLAAARAILYSPYSPSYGLPQPSDIPSVQQDHIAPLTSETEALEVESEINQRNGGVDINNDTAKISGDVVGRDKITYINALDPQEVEKQRRVEATFPAQPVIGQIESLYVQVKMPESPVGLEARTRTMVMPFKANANTGAAMPTPFKIKVIAPGFRIHGGDEKVLRVLPDEDSKELEFQLQCESDQAVRIQVEIYAESGYLDQLVLPVTPVVMDQVPLATERMWMRGVFVLGTLPNVSVSSSW